MEEYKNCPYCQGELEKGRMLTHHFNTFLPDRIKIPLFHSVKKLTAQGAVCLPPDYWSPSLKAEFAIAYHCPKCKTIIIPYE